MKKTALRTESSRFLSLPGYCFSPHYIAVTHPDYEPLQLHYIDEGNAAGLPVLLLHGCPTWSYLYRKVISRLVASPHGQQLRVIAPDHIGCGKSDKLLERSHYTYDFYVRTIREFIQRLDLRNITLVCQDWGGPIGLRVFSEIPERFARIVVTNTLLPDALPPPRSVANWPGEMIEQWVTFTRSTNDMSMGNIVQGVCIGKLSAEIIAAYDAPFPDARYKQGMLNWPSLIPLTADSIGIMENRRAWEVLEKNDIPLLTAFSDGDPSTVAWENIFQHRAKGAQYRTHVTIKGAGHMVQEDKGEELAGIVEKFIFE